jgi:hypothetical protein
MARRNCCWPRSRSDEFFFFHIEILLVKRCHNNAFTLLIQSVQINQTGRSRPLYRAIVTEFQLSTEKPSDRATARAKLQQIVVSNDEIVQQHSSTGLHVVSNAEIIQQQNSTGLHVLSNNEIRLAYRVQQSPANRACISTHEAELMLALVY